MGVLFTACENTRSPHLEPSGTSQSGDLPQYVYICTASVFSRGQEDTCRPYSCSPTCFCLTYPHTDLTASLQGVVHPPIKFCHHFLMCFTKEDINLPVASQHFSITRIFPSCLHQKSTQLFKFKTFISELYFTNPAAHANEHT